MRLLVLECKTVLEDKMLPLSAKGAENLVHAQGPSNWKGG